jgi:hypothetical protein
MGKKIDHLSQEHLEALQADIIRLSSLKHKIKLDIQSLVLERETLREGLRPKTIIKNDSLWTLIYHHSQSVIVQVSQRAIQYIEAIFISYSPVEVSPSFSTRISTFSVPEPSPTLQQRSSQERIDWLLNNAFEELTSPRYVR